MPRQTNSPQSRERRLRRLAARLGLSIRKVGSGRERGLFHLETADAEPQPYSAKRPKSDPPITLDELEAEIEKRMASLGMRDDED